MIVSVGHLLENTASRLPNKTALVTKKNSLTYKELDEHVNALAWGLLKAGLKKGMFIACLLSNGIEIIETQFASAKIGAVLIPINPCLKPAEIEGILKHSECQMLIADDALSNTINHKEMPLLKTIRMIWVGQNSLPDNYNQLKDFSPKLKINAHLDRNDTASILYTSGTSGSPKAVSRTHANNVWSALSVVTFGNYTPTDKELWLLPLYGIGFFTFFLPNIIAGCTIYLMEEFNPVSIFTVIEKQGINRMYLVPSQWKMLCKNSSIKDFNLSSFVTALIGSAPVTYETRLLISKAFPSTEIYEFWGMTEGGLISISPWEASEHSCSIGKPAPYHEATLMDDFGMEVPPGNIGEIATRGPAVISSYFKATKEIDSSFMKGGWFRTGDLARRDNQGFYYLTGRKTDLIISGENKIWPSEIEQVLENHPKIREAATFAIDDALLGEIPVAAIVVEPGEAINETELLDYLTMYLANYKIPKHFFQTTALPISEQGKVVKEKLKEIFLFSIKEKLPSE